MTATTYFLRDILRQPSELQQAIDYLAGAGHKPLQEAASIVKRSRVIFLTGIGASWHAALSAGSLLSLSGNPVFLQEAAELLHFGVIPRDALVIAISRTGRSIEIIQLLAKAKETGATVIGITNSPESPLAKESAIPIVIPARLDHAISVNTYSTLAVAAGALAESVAGSFQTIAPSLSRAVAGAERCLGDWQNQLADCAWLAREAPFYFLARGSSLGSCHEARLLWEEGAKMPATAMSTGGFRHGPQEIVTAGVRFGLWIDSSRMREQDLAVAEDLKSLGASVAVIGQKIPKGAGSLVFQLPQAPPNWQFVIDIVPMQLAAERMARLGGVDCDSFRVCSYVVEDEHGLPGKKRASADGQ